MSATVVPGEKAKLYYSVDAGSTYVEIGNILSITPPPHTLEEVKKTVLSSTVQEYRASLIPDMGVLQFNVEHDPDNTSHSTLIGWITTPLATDPTWKIEYTGDAHTTHCKDVFTGFLKEWKPSEMSTSPDNLQSDCSVRVTSVITRTAGS